MSSISIKATVMAAVIISLGAGGIAAARLIPENRASVRAASDSSRDVADDEYDRVVAAVNDEVAREEARQRSEDDFLRCRRETFTKVLARQERFDLSRGQVRVSDLDHPSCEGFAPTTIEAAIIDELDVLCVAEGIGTSELWGMGQGVCIPAGAAEAYRRSRKEYHDEMMSSQVRCVPSDVPRGAGSASDRASVADRTCPPGSYLIGD